LVVDNDADVRLLLGLALEGAGYEVSTADGALRIVQDVEEYRPDLVLVDYAMTGFKGTQAIRLLRQKMGTHALPDVPIALMSTDAPAEVLKRARSEGAIAYIDKGMGPDGICKAVEAILTQQLVHLD
jgi:two-component system chemotaxis response regulator CheY